ncbi:hypothetical protein [Moorena producens]|uniref:hypothetical protein n=1 Tax=Moorena producens TaxID=1155739 RepID=UPI003C75D082
MICLRDNRKLSAISYQLSAISYQLSAISYQLLNKRCSAVLGSQCGLGGLPHEQLAWFPP